MKLGESSISFNPPSILTVALYLETLKLKGLYFEALYLGALLKIHGGPKIGPRGTYPHHILDDLRR